MRRGSKVNRLLDFWVGIPVLNGFAGLRSVRSFPETDVRRVGMLCSQALGDTLLFSSVVADVRAHLNTVMAEQGPIELIHLCMKGNLPATELIPGIDRRVVLEVTRIGPSLAKIRAEKLDVLLDFTQWQRLTAFYSMMSGARFTAGFSCPGQYRGRAYDVQAEHRRDRHEVENFRAVLRAVGIATGSEPRLEVPEILVAPLAEEQDIVVFHPWASGTLSRLREWPEESWLQLGHRIGRAETLFVVTGGPTDEERSIHLAALLEGKGFRAEPYRSPDGFVSLSHLLKRARAVISVNTGVMHLAAILGAPVVSLNGPTSTHRWGPWGPRVAGVQASDGTGGYLHLGFEFSGHPTDVMEKISVDSVARAVDALERGIFDGPGAIHRDAREESVHVAEASGMEVVGGPRRAVRHAAAG